jgi:hypothetical protein
VIEEVFSNPSDSLNGAKPSPAAFEWVVFGSPSSAPAPRKPRKRVQGVASPDAARVSNFPAPRIETVSRSRRTGFHDKLEIWTDVTTLGADKNRTLVGVVHIIVKKNKKYV